MSGMILVIGMHGKIGWFIQAHFKSSVSYLFLIRAHSCISAIVLAPPFVPSVTGLTPWFPKDFSTKPNVSLQTIRIR